MPELRPSYDQEQWSRPPQNNVLPLKRPTSRPCHPTVHVGIFVFSRVTDYIVGRGVQLRDIYHILVRISIRRIISGCKSVRYIPLSFAFLTTIAEHITHYSGNSACSVVFIRRRSDIHRRILQV